MPKSRDDIDVREIMAAGEDITRTVIGSTLDAISSSAIERQAKWRDTDDAIRALQRIRGAVNSGEELTWAVVDFWLSVLPDPEVWTLRVHVDNDAYEALADQGRSLGMTPEGFVTALAQKSAIDHRAAAEADVATVLRDMLVIAGTGQQAEQWVIANAEALTGWRISTFLPGHQPLRNLYGHLWHMAVYLGNADDRVKAAVEPGVRKGDAPTIIRVDPAERFNPEAALEEQRLRNEGLA